jgi:hypothetical protein
MVVDDILTDDEALSLLALNFAEEFSLSFLKFFMLKLTIEAIPSHFVKVVHI